MSVIREVIESAAGQLAATGKVEHLFTTCTREGTVHAKPTDTEEITCTACQINQLAKESQESDWAIRRSVLRRR